MNNWIRITGYNSLHILNSFPCITLYQFTLNLGLMVTRLKPIGQESISPLAIYFTSGAETFRDHPAHFIGSKRLQVPGVRGNSLRSRTKLVLRPCLTAVHILSLSNLISCWFDFKGRQRRGQSNVGSHISALINIKRLFTWLMENSLKMSSKPPMKFIRF